MKVWQAILIFLLIGIIGLLGFNYMKLYLEFRGLKTDIEIQKMMENEKKEPAKDNIENVEKIENNNELEVEDKFYNVLENHSSKFNIYVHHETVEENIRRCVKVSPKKPKKPKKPKMSKKLKMSIVRIRKSKRIL